MTLLDYFKPLDPNNLFIFILMFASWHIVGSLIDKKWIKLPQEFTLIRWTFGLAIWILTVYLSHFFYPLRPITVLATYLPIFLICLAKTKFKFTLLSKQIIFNSLILLLPLVMIVKPVFVKLSLPPHLWDEMAYHWVSPSTIAFEKTWNLSGGLYQSMPRSLETAAIGLFVLTKTYSSARLLQFLIFLTTAATVYLNFKKNFGLISAIGSYLAIVFFSPDLISLSSSGYVDVAASSFIILALLTQLYPNLLIGKIGFVALAIGMKYSVLSSTISIILVSLVSYIKTVKKSILVPTLLAFLLFGGYWYVKNTILYHNPVFPLIFACDTCPKKTDIFGSWTVPITLANIDKIKSSLFNKLFNTDKLVITSLLLLFFLRNKKTIRYTIFLASILIIDWMLSSRFTAFEPRYFIHWQLIVILFVTASWNLTKAHHFLKTFAFLLIAYSAFSVYQNTANTINTLKLAYIQNPRELAYAKGMINIYDWTRAYFPRLNEVIKWCETAIPDTPIRVTDPELIWGNYDALFSIFMTNCSHSRDELSTYSRTKPLYAVSLSECVKDLPQDNTDGKYYFRKNNNDVICNSQKLKPYLYKFTGFN